MWTDCRRPRKANLRNEPAGDSCAAPRRRSPKHVPPLRKGGPGGIAWRFPDARFAIAYSPCKDVEFEIEPQIHTRLRDEAIRRNVSITALALEWLKSFFDRLPPAEHERQGELSPAE